MRYAPWYILSAALLLAACLFDKAPEEIDLTLTKLPAGTDSVVVRAVDRSDTSIVLEAKLFAGKYAAGKVLHFALGKVQGREDNSLLRVEGYRNSLLVYMSLIPPGSGSTDEVLFPDVTHAWPTISFTKVEKSGDAYVLSTAIRGAEAESFWKLSPNVPQTNQRTLTATGNAFTLGATGLVPGTWITAQLFTGKDTTALLPVQVPDSLLTDEVISPSGATVEILDAVRVVDVASGEDTVQIKLDIRNFTSPSRDEPIPGRGWAKVLDARGLKPIPDFHVLEDDFTRIHGPSWRLGGVSHIVVALHYANGSRISPLISDTVLSSIALQDRTSLPTVEIASAVKADSTIKFTFTRTNFTRDMHVHVYKDQVNAKDYMICWNATCTVGPDVHAGATRLIAIVVNPDHSIFTPQSRDTLNAPF